MRRIAYMAIALFLLLTACSAPAQVSEPSMESGGCVIYGVYEFTFQVEKTHGCSPEDWDFVYTYNEEKILSGHQLLFPLGVFSFRSIKVEVFEKDGAGRGYSSTFPVAVCDGGTGRTGITVTGSDGRTAEFEISCEVTQVGTRSIDPSRPAGYPAGLLYDIEQAVCEMRSETVNVHRKFVNKV